MQAFNLVITPPHASIICLLARHCPRSWESRSLGRPILGDYGILCRKQEVMGKMNHSCLYVTIDQALS